MTTRHETGSLRRRLLAPAVCAALLAQMVLPALHALEAEGSARRGVAASQIASACSAVVARAAQTEPAHDPATCPVCRTLTRTSPVVSTPVPGGEPGPEAAPAPHAARVRAASDVAGIGHPPRAPPADAFHLA